MRAKKSLGQNFLVDANLQRKIVEALGARPDDEVLEIGPGRGALTRHLVGQVRRLVLVEVDDALAEALRQDWGERTDVDVIHADVLDLSLNRLSSDPAALRVVGNIPYNITTPLIFWLLEQRPRPERAVLMVQREVADRILAGPGEKAYGALTVGVRTVAEVERLFHVGRRSFRPVPDVDSTVIRIRPHRPPRLGPDEEAEVRRLTRAAFRWRRKQLQKILRAAPEYALSTDALERVHRRTGLDLNARPESLSPDEFVALARALSSPDPATPHGASPSSNRRSRRDDRPLGGGGAANAGGRSGGAA